jgi:hypothetical protein
MSTPGRTHLSDAVYRQALNVAIRHLRTDGALKNKNIRTLAGLNYDQAIKFFNRAVAEGALVRVGRSGGTHYELSE